MNPEALKRMSIDELILAKAGAQDVGDKDEVHQIEDELLKRAERGK